MSPPVLGNGRAGCQCVCPHCAGKSVSPFSPRNFSRCASGGGSLPCPLQESFCPPVCPAPPGCLGGGDWCLRGWPGLSDGAGATIMLLRFLPRPACMSIISPEPCSGSRAGVSPVSLDGKKRNAAGSPQVTSSEEHSQQHAGPRGQGGAQAPGPGCSPPRQAAHAGERPRPHGAGF